ncbi:hypothetical protein E1B28_008083 [Marasmius oreades]|uniref:Uncharacterized protein n=1 Tax=Marasmius oreades TaxID=181124 RepID=A0A9P7S3A3_9AGAR|nr:uncharacterized protein E1B28_008083 [Marasmius oreades]KAG7094485.1 hypothetical protein E1B28_008083 [Marasmius oreades]
MSLYIASSSIGHGGRVFLGMFLSQSPPDSTLPSYNTEETAMVDRERAFSLEPILWVALQHVRPSPAHWVITSPESGAAPDSFISARMPSCSYTQNRHIQ